MGRPIGLRLCDRRCHLARGEKCGCWCAGLFHGRASGEARERFQKKHGRLPGKLEEFASLTGLPAPTPGLKKLPRYRIVKGKRRRIYDTKRKRLQVLLPFEYPESLKKEIEAQDSDVYRPPRRSTQG